MKPVPLIPNPRFWICTRLFLMKLFLPIYDKRYHFDFEFVNFPFIDGDVPRSTSY